MASSLGVSQRRGSRHASSITGNPSSLVASSGHLEQTELSHVTAAQPSLPAQPTQNAKETRKRRGFGAAHSIVNNFSQQKLKAWQPVLTPKWIVSVFIGFGLLFGIVGAVLLVTSNGVVECVTEYRDPENACSNVTACTTVVVKDITTDDCIGPRPDQKIRPPIFVYYELVNYYQNHRRYVKSRNDQQLAGEVFTDPSDLSSCDPIIVGPNNRIFSPCGLVAWSVFNDSYTLLKDGNVISMNDDASVIAWSVDVQYRFKNPPSDKTDPTVIYEWLNEELFPGKVENGHFIVWMRSAALPTFRKLYAKIETEIQLPIQVSIANRYPVGSFGGRKRLVLSTTSWLGGRNQFLGIAYLVVSAWCLAFGIFFILKNYKSPR